MGAVRCKICKVPKSAFWLKDTYKGGCAREEALQKSAWCCNSMRADLLQSALMRAVLPDAFGGDGRIKKGRLLDALKARDDAMQRMARLKGPMLVETPASYNTEKDG